jgi:hypothetical protein
MRPMFYIGAGIIIFTVLLNAVFKNIKKTQI